RTARLVAHHCGLYRPMVTAQNFATSQVALKMTKRLHEGKKFSSIIGSPVVRRRDFRNNAVPFPGDSQRSQQIRTQIVLLFLPDAIPSVAAARISGKLQDNLSG